MATITAPTITAYQAQAEAGGFLSDHLPDRFCTGSPHFDQDAYVWRVPVLLSDAGIGPVGQVGEIIVSAAAEEVLSYTPLNEMKSTALRLYEQKRDAIETTFLLKSEETNGYSKPFDNKPSVNLPHTEIEVMAAVGGFLNDNLPDRFCAGRPQFDQNSHVWRVPVLLSYPSLGSLGQTGEITVGNETNQILFFTPVEEMKTAARAIIEQHREEIEAPLP